MTIHSLPDIVGNNTAVPLATIGKVRRIWLTSLTGASRFGDSNVGAARGVALPASVEVTISASDADIADSIDLTQAFAYVPSGDTLTIAYGN